jgi:dTMP kinase
MFVSFEGLDGSGKTTQMERLRQALEAEGREVVATREPGGTELGERVRELLLGDGEISPWAEAALFAAARAELVESVIGPALDRGAHVLCDRYVDSSLAYQGLARGLGVDRVLELNLNPIRNLLPDRTLLLVVPPDVALRRKAGASDRIEREGGQFMNAVDRAYRELAGLFPQRITEVDGARPEDVVAEEIRGLVRELS